MVRVSECKTLIKKLNDIAWRCWELLVLGNSPNRQERPGQVTTTGVCGKVRTCDRSK